MEYTQVMVLNDGETFSNVSGCKIVLVPDEWNIDQIENALRDESEDMIVVTCFT